jgi:hypothetical protein
MRPLDPHAEASLLVASGFVAPAQQAALAGYLEALRFLDELGRGPRDHHDFPRRAKEFHDWLRKLEGFEGNERMRPLVQRVREIVDRADTASNEWTEETDRHRAAVSRLEQRRGDIERDMSAAIDALKTAAGAGRQ